MAAALIVVFSLMLLLCGGGLLLRTRWFTGWLNGSAGLLLVATAFYGALFAENLRRYQPADNTSTLATISVQKTAPQAYTLTVNHADGRLETVLLEGDLWHLQARVLEWAPLLRGAGFKTRYRLDRLEGRYFTLEDERNRARTAHLLHRPEFGIDIWQRAQRGWSFMVDARYGSAAYLPMLDGAIFEVSATPTGLVSRPVNRAAQHAVSLWD